MKKRRYSSPYIARDYFSRDILPQTVLVGRKNLRQSLPYRQQDGLMLLLVRGGEGTVTVNGKAYPARRGSLFCFASHHFHKIELSRGGFMEVTECHTNPGLYLYLTACPYYSAAVIPAPPLCAALPDAPMTQAEGIMEDLAQQCEKGPVSENQSLYFLLMKLFGLLEKYAAHRT